MGAWGAGPFDNDSALDFLADVADKAKGERNEDFELDLKTIDKTIFLAEVKNALVNGDYFGSQDARYAAAGLVAAALATNLTPSASTSLFARLDGEHTVNDQDPIDLSAGMEYITVLDRDDVADLVPMAIEAVEKIRNDDDFIQMWNSTSEIMSNLDKLTAALTD